MHKKKVIEKTVESNRIHQLIIFLIPFILYVQTCSFDYSYHDDDSIVLYNAQSLQQFDLKKIFFSDAWMMDKKIELYRPFQSFTYAIDYFFTGTKPFGYHLHNVLIFCLCIQLLYFFLLSIKLNERTSFFLSLLFSVHFLFAHTVSWIPARGDLYLFAFSISGLLLFYLSLQRQKTIYAVAASLCYFSAMLSKESAIVLLPLIYGTAYFLWKPDWKKLKVWLMLLISIPLLGIYLWMRQQSISPIVNVFTVSGFVYNLPIIPESVFKFFIPFGFSVMPAFSFIATAGGLLLIGLFVLLVFRFRKTLNQPLLVTGVLFFIFPLLPSVIYKPAFTGFAYDYLDHRMLFPGIGLLLIAYILFTVTVEKYFSNRIIYPAVAILSVITFINASAYKNYESYYENAIATNPKSGLAHSNYGASLARENKYDRALNQFNTAVTLSPDNIEVRMKLADAYFTLKNYPLMTEQCNAVIKINPKFPKSYYNIALYYEATKNYSAAETFIAKAVTADSLNAEAFLYSGLIAEGIGKPDSAMHFLRRAVTLQPQLALAYFRMGVIAGNKSLFKEALQYFDTYVTLNPNDGNGYFYRGQAYCMTGNTGTGCTDLHTAESMGVLEARAKINYWCK